MGGGGGGAEVVVVGNAGVDTNVYLDRAEIDPAVDGHFTRNLDYVGQAGGFASRGYARLGYRTAFVGALGDDSAGALVRATLAGEGVDLRGVFADPTGTARSVNLVFDDGRRRYFYDGKGHMTLRPDLERCGEILSGARLAHVNIPNWGRELLPLARARSVAIACDLQDVGDPGDPYRRDFVVGADYLFFSAANHPEPRAVVEAYWRLNPALTMVVGMGERGCALASEGGIEFFPPPPLALPVVDANGAGDALAVGFLTARVIEGRSPTESVLRGQVAARHACSLAAPKADLVTRERLEAYVRSLVGGGG